MIKFFLEKYNNFDIFLFEKDEFIQENKITIVLDRINSGYYKSKLYYPEGPIIHRMIRENTENYHKIRRAYKNDYHRLRDLFREDLEKETNMFGHTEAESLWDHACNSVSGDNFQEIYNVYLDFLKKSDHK